MTLGEIKNLIDKTNAMPPLPPFPSNANSSGPSLSGGYSYIDYNDTQKREQDDILEEYEKAKEIMIKEKKIISYAEQNKFDVQETLEAFFSEDELDLYENFTEIKREAEQVIEKRKLEEKVRKE